ncbi:MAG: type II toxin-antitoxin system prevent-host-death family antitoxin [Terracidiphilus sp.]|jgi:prevent-host-death family protein
MRTIPASKAQADLDRILDEVERGESILISRNGRIVARIDPVAKAESAVDPEQVKQAAASIRALRERTQPVSLEEILSARDEGRL